MSKSLFKESKMNVPMNSVVALSIGNTVEITGTVVGYDEPFYSVHIPDLNIVSLVEDSQMSVISIPNA